MNGSNVRGSLAPYGDVLAPYNDILAPYGDVWCSNGIFTKQGIFSFQKCNDSLQINLVGNKNKWQVSFGIFLISLATYWYFYSLPTEKKR